MPIINLAKLLKRSTKGWEKRWKDDPNKPVKERIKDALDAKYGTLEEHEAQERESQDEWFWTEEWQKGERDADEDIAEGDVIGPFDNIDDALHALKTAKI